MADHRTIPALPHPKGGVQSPAEFQLTLQALPTEIVLEIFYTLEIPSILILRQACKRLYDISRIYSIWSIAFYRFTRALPFKYYLDRPLQFFSAQAVEAMVADMVKLEANWMSDRPKPTRVRELPGPYAANNTSKLLPGGRWLLSAADSTGRVMAYDLDTLAMNVRTLVQLNDPIDQLVPHCLTVSVHGDEDFMTFDLAVLFTARKASVLPLRLSIWRITSGPDEGTPPFTSQHLQSLSISNVGTTSSISMRSELFMRVGRLTLPPQIRFDVFHWRHCSSTYHQKVWFTIDDSEHAYIGSYLLPNDRIVCLFQTSLIVYDIPKVEGMRDSESATAPFVVQPHWVFDFRHPYGQGMGLTLSPPGPWSHTASEYSPVIFGNADRIYMVFVPTDRGGPPREAQTIDSPSPEGTRKVIRMGNYRGICVHMLTGNVTTLTLWFGNTSKTTGGALQQLCTPPDGQVLERIVKFREGIFPFLPLFDEQSGRSIFSMRSDVSTVVSLVTDFV